MNDTIYTVRLEDDTVGQFEDKKSNYYNLVGTTRTVYLQDENGNIFKKSGKIVEILQ